MSLHLMKKTLLLFFFSCVRVSGRERMLSPNTCGARNIWMSDCTHVGLGPHGGTVKMCEDVKGKEPIVKHIECLQAFLGFW